MSTNLRPVLSGWSVRWYQCWGDWMPWNRGRMNWRNFTVAHIDVEWMTTFPRSLDITFVLFGVGVMVDWHQPHDVARLEAMAHRQAEAMRRDEEGEEWKRETP